MTVTTHEKVVAGRQDFTPRSVYQAAARLLEAIQSQGRSYRVYDALNNPQTWYDCGAAERCPGIVAAAGKLHKELRQCRRAHDTDDPANRTVSAVDPLGNKPLAASLERYLGVEHGRWKAERIHFEHAALSALAEAAEGAR